MPSLEPDLPEGFHERFMAYAEEFGPGFSTFHVRGALAERVMREMQRALDGERGEITDEELGLDIPTGAVS